jgi:hypothetical protein
MRLPSVFGVVSGMYRMAARSVSMMGGFLVLPSVVVLGSFSVMTGSMCVVLCRFAVMISRFLRHLASSEFKRVNCLPQRFSCLHDVAMTGRRRSEFHAMSVAGES